MKPPPAPWVIETLAALAREAGRPTVLAVSCAAVLGLGNGASRADPAWDDASLYAYDDGWQVGDDSGFGWQPWLSPSSIGSLGVGTSTANGNGDDDQDGDIDTSGRSWRIVPYGTSDTTIMWRRLVVPLAVGERIAVDVDHDFAGVHTGWVGIQFRAAGGGDPDYRLTLSWSPYLGQVEVNDATGYVPLPIPATDEGYRIELTVTGPDDYSLRVKPHGMPAVTHAGPLYGTGALGTIELGARGDGQPRLVFFNSLTAPEPGDAAAWTAVCALGLLARRLRRAAM